MQISQTTVEHVTETEETLVEKTRYAFGVIPIKYMEVVKRGMLGSYISVKTTNEIQAVLVNGVEYIKK